MNATARDQHIRDHALNPDNSYIVQAPAGSGKTELLVTRFVTLLARVEQPEHLLAITFTKKAASEMQQRVLLALNSQANGTTNSVSPQLAQAAATALEQDTRQEWHILANPGRLKIMTIDALCLQLARQTPLHTGISHQSSVTSETGLYRQAVRSLMTQLQQPLDNKNSEQESPLERLFRHYGCDGNALETLLIHMLSNREQWLTLFASLRQADSNTLFADLNDQLQQQAQYHISLLLDACGKWFTEIQELAQQTLRHAPENIIETLTTLASQWNDDDSVEQQMHYWCAIQTWLGTTTGQLRKTVNKNTGFPATEKAIKQRMLDVLEDMREQEIEPLLFTPLPQVRYNDQQLQILADLAEVCVEAAARFELFSNEQQTTDFSGTAHKALDALGSDENPGMLAERTHDRFHHILIDEFQDTSKLQYELLRRLVRDWSWDSGKYSVFIVGDPKQSIYRFRQAEPAIFHRVAYHGIDQIQPELLTLESNFRSASQLVDWYNTLFNQLFPQRPDYSLGETQYNPSIAERQKTEEVPLLFSVISCDEKSEQENAATSIHRKMVDEISLLQQSGSINTIAILTRSRKQASRSIDELGRRGIAYLAVDQESLDSQQHILDVLSLIQAIHNEEDRISWLALLRHPAIGLTLPDALILCRNGDATLWHGMHNLPKEISSDGVLRINHCVSALSSLLDKRYRMSWPLLVADAWRATGMTDILNQEQKNQCEGLLHILQQHCHGSHLDMDGFLDRFAGNKSTRQSRATHTHNPVYVMTIHKAKGLEFDAVFLPELEKSLSRGGGRQPPPFLWDTIVRDDGTSLILAPYKARNETETSALYRYLQHLEKKKNTAELLRLLYVACTRAKICLRLYAVVSSQQFEGESSGNNFAQWLIHAGVQTETLSVTNEPREQYQQHNIPVLTRIPSASFTKQYTAPQQPQGSDTAINHDIHNNTARQLGVVIHALIEQTSKRPCLLQELEGEQNRLDFIATHTPNWCKNIRQQGIAIDSRQEIEQLACKALTGMILDDTGRWLLTRNNMAMQEWSLESIDNNNTIYKRIIDRSFIEGDVRWIVDYKAASMYRDEGMEQFTTRMRTTYQQQLNEYAKLVHSLEHQQIRLGLYLPLQTQWVQWQWQQN